jgi:hypothetical protein
VNSGGTLSTTGSGNSSAYVNLDANMDVKAGGTLTIANPATMVNAFTLTNVGTWQVTATGHISIGGGCVVNTTGTLGVTVGSGATPPDGTILQNNGEFTGTGTLAVHTVGGEAPAEVITAPNGLAATFSKFSFGTHHYTVTDVKNTSGEVIGLEVTPASG